MYFIVWVPRNYFVCGLDMRKLVSVYTVLVIRPRYAHFLFLKFLNSCILFNIDSLNTVKYNIVRKPYI